MRTDPEIRALRLRILGAMVKYRYSYNFTWLGRPIIQIPDDVLALQEIVFSTKPEVIVETGVAHGGSLILWASLLELLGEGRVVGVDIDIRPENRTAIEAHPLSHRVTLVEGASTSDGVVRHVHSLCTDHERVLVLLDSDHTHAHVLRELELYSPLVRKGSYLVVLDTAIEDMPEDSYPGKAWSKYDNPKTAVREFLASCDRFVVDHEVEDKLLVSVAPEGYLRCVKD
jgi:cephalosporin hydroxylase